MASSTTPQSPILDSCICLKYLNPQKQISIRIEKSPNPAKGMSLSGRDDSQEHQEVKVQVETDSKEPLETDSLEQHSPTLRTSPIQIGMLLNLSLTDDRVTTFNNHNDGMPQLIMNRCARKRFVDTSIPSMQFRSMTNECDGDEEDPTGIVFCSHHHPHVKPTTHTQIDFTNFLIPGQRDIMNCTFYWGKIDRYEAEALLADKPEGSFLLRDSAQDDFVFSVSFRRYSRSLHARIEEEGHMFSFDSHDPGVHASHSVRGLLEHYKDPLSCMFFEPMLLFPVVRKSCFSLQSLARASICDNITYSGVTQLPLPKVLKQYLREYHYRHKIRTRYIETAPDDST